MIPPCSYTYTSDILFLHTGTGRIVGGIVGGIIAAIALALVIIGIVLFLRKYLRKRKAKSPDHDELEAFK